MHTVDKAFAYITNAGRLLVFEHVHVPSAGVQVPAGSVKPGEPTALAAVREAREETGLDGFGDPVFLGVVAFDARPFGVDQLHRRHFYHLPLDGAVPERWRHAERDPSDGSPEPILFELYWIPLAEAPTRLAHGHAALLGGVAALTPRPPSPTLTRRRGGSRNGVSIPAPLVRPSDDPGRGIRGLPRRPKEAVMPEFVILMRENDNAWSKKPAEEQQRLPQGYFAWVRDLRERDILSPRWHRHGHVGRPPARGPHRSPRGPRPACPAPSDLGGRPQSATASGATTSRSSAAAMSARV